MARPPALDTIFEERKLRTRRVELADPLKGSSLRFSASYCPQSYGVSHSPGVPFVWQHEHLENFAVLARWNTHYINVTRTLSRDHVEGMRTYALRLYREAFARGELH